MFLYHSSGYCFFLWMIIHDVVRDNDTYAKVDGHICMDPMVNLCLTTIAAVYERILLFYRFLTRHTAYQIDSYRSHDDHKLVAIVRILNYNTILVILGYMLR